MGRKITITIDGYAGCGKSTLARQLAQKLGYIYLDTGAMYRAVTLYFLRHNIKVANTVAVRQVLQSINISFKKDAGGGPLTYLNGALVEEEIRTPKVSGYVSKVSALRAVRQKLVEQQRQIGKKGGVVTDGRDTGTVVFPDAALKLFITAKLEVRVNRRFLELSNRGIKTSKHAVAKELQQRDHQDEHRKESPLRQAADAVVLDTSRLSREAQLARALDLAQSRINT